MFHFISVSLNIELKWIIGLYWVSQVEISSLVSKSEIFIIEDIFFAGP